MNATSNAVVTANGGKVSAVARLIAPAGDKSYSFQMVSDELPGQGEFMFVMRLPDVKVAQPFLQGYDGRKWAMIEFSVRDPNIALKAAQACADHFEIDLKHGDFTRDELGL